MEWSHYQNRLFDFTSDSTDNAIVEAVPGSGKTTSIIEAARRIPMDKNPMALFDDSQNCLFLAFEKHTADTTGKLLPSNCFSRTINSHGYELCRNQLGTKRLNKYKIDDILDKMGVPNPFKLEGEEAKREARALRYSITSIISVMKATFVFDLLADIMDVLNFYGTYIHDDDPTIVGTALRALEIDFSDTTVVDFDDMFFLPLVHNCQFPSYKTIFVDEAQDLSRAQRLYIKRLNSRIIAVGDRNQSIYGFRCADPFSMDRLAEEFNTTSLPLNICYRCDQEIVKYAQTIVPEIEWREDADIGLIDTIDRDRFLNYIKPHDMVLCRYNAPLVEIALGMIRTGHKVTVRGRDIGKNIAIFARKFFRHGTKLEVGLQHMRTYVQQELKRPGTYEKKQELVDKAAVVQIFTEVPNAISHEIPIAIELLFSDDVADTTLSSIHKAKGSESNRVFIIKAEDRQKGSRTEWGVKQENNCKYVACTRPRHELYFVEEEHDTTFQF